jgi:hypothetical protein
MVVHRPEPPANDPPKPRPPIPRAAPAPGSAGIDVGALLGGGRPRSSLPWIFQHPRIFGGCLLASGTIFAAGVYDFFFRGGLLSSRFDSLLIHAGSPALIAFGLWLLLFGVPKDQPAWWAWGLRIVGGAGIIASLWLGVQIQATPKETVDRRKVPDRAWRAPRVKPVERPQPDEAAPDE